MNKTFGREMGDRLIARAAEGMKKIFRKEDIVRWIGGDEFAILLPRTSEDQANILADKLKKEYRGNPLDYITISVSFGLATRTREEEDTVDIINIADERMYTMRDMENAQSKEEWLIHMKKALESKNLESKEDIEKLTKQSLIMAEKFGLGDSSKEDLKFLSEHHNIGLLGVPRDILSKTGDLTLKEWKKLRGHTKIGYQILRDINKDISRDILVFLHHESWDGKGYPGLLKGGDIPIEVRIFSVVDAYQSMVSHKPYRKAMTREQAANRLKKNSGKRFDPEVVDVFLDLEERLCI